MRSPNETITSRIPRKELVGLLDTMTPFDKQRVTAEHEIVDTAAIVGTLPVQDEEVKRTSTLHLVVRFVPQADAPAAVAAGAAPAEETRLPSWAIVAGSGVITLLIGCLTMAAA